MFSIFSVLIQIIGEILAWMTVHYFLPQSTCSVPHTLFSYVLLNAINMGIRYASLELFHRWRKWDMSRILLSFTFNQVRFLCSLKSLFPFGVFMYLLSTVPVLHMNLSSELSQVDKLSICFVLGKVVEMEGCEKRISLYPEWVHSLV